MRAAAATAIAALTDPATWFPAPLNVDGVGDMALVGELEFPLILLTRRDGQGAVAEDAYAAVRVTITSGAGPVGQEVPHAARTVDYLCVSDAPDIHNTVISLTMLCALAPRAATRAKAAIVNFILVLNECT